MSDEEPTVLSLILDLVLDPTDRGFDRLAARGWSARDVMDAIRDLARSGDDDTVDGALVDLLGQE